MDNILAWVLIFWNIVVFGMYGADKRRAIKMRRRISEKRLIVAAFLMGAPGAALGMYVFHHKTRKPIFNILIPASLVVNGLVFIFLERI